MRIEGLVASTILIVGTVLACQGDFLLDCFLEGDYDPRHVQAGRHAGAWLHEGSPEDLAEFAPGLERIEFEVDGTGPGATGRAIVNGRAYTYREHEWNGNWLQFEVDLPFLSKSSYGDRFEIMLEAKRDPARDWLYVFFGEAGDSRRGFAFSRQALSTD